jgi:uncharacterized protein
VNIENSFVVSAPPAAAWTILTDIERIAPCVPGASLSESTRSESTGSDVNGDQSYKGSIKVRLGPVSLTFKGEMRFIERDDNAWTAQLAASGQEGRNRGTASANVHISLKPEADGTRVHINTELQLAGMIAQYGRGAGVIQTVAESLITQFTECLERNILAAPIVAAPDETTPEGAAVNNTEPVRQAEALSVVSLFIDVIRRFIRRLFGERT